MGLANSGVMIDLDDLVQEGSLSLLNAIPHSDDSKGLKFLTYAAPAIRNAMTDLVRSELSRFEQKLTDGRNKYLRQAVLPGQRPAQASEG